MTAPALRELVVVASVLTVGLVGAAVVTASRDADTEFLFRQQHPLRLGAAEVERVVRTAPDPRLGKGPGGVRAECRAQGQAGLRNPWSCTVRYRSGRRARLLVRIRGDGSYLGRYAGGGTAEGCCIELSGAG